MSRLPPFSYIARWNVCLLLGPLAHTWARHKRATRQYNRAVRQYSRAVRDVTYRPLPFFVQYSQASAGGLCTFLCSPHPACSGRHRVTSTYDSGTKARTSSGTLQAAAATTAWRRSLQTLSSLLHTSLSNISCTATGAPQHHPALWHARHPPPCY